jgi:hypothetical protein
MSKEPKTIILSDSAKRHPIQGGLSLEQLTEPNPQT